MKIIKEITLLAITTMFVSAVFVLTACRRPIPPVGEGITGPEDTTQTETPFNFNLYVEYSGSMYGYLDYQYHERSLM